MDKVHNLQFHISDQLYYALHRKKLEFCQAGYNCKTWKQFLFFISTMPVITPKKIEDERRTYEILNKLKDYNLGSSDLADKLQNKAQRNYNDNAELDELMRQRDILIEATSNPDLDQSEFIKYLSMLETANQKIALLESQEQ